MNCEDINMKSVLKWEFYLYILIHLNWDYKCIQVVGVKFTAQSYFDITYVLCVQM